MNDFGKMAFIGGGNMAGALIGGLIRRGARPAQIVVADPSGERRSALGDEFGISVSADNAQAIAGAEVVVLAVKPQQMRSVALTLAPGLCEARSLVVSVAAGIPHAALARWFGSQVPVVRTMPNRPALNGFGATGLYAPASVGAAYRALAESIMSAVSATVWVEHESQMDTVTALSGSGPAYFFLFMEALEAAAHERGLPSDIAHRLTLETAFGAAQMARQS
ncbi:MAG: pyrroline-5-carboxylate reductase, partial [Steroidobacteraceae bacterium]|nr:pyrroline-5-carboxylate reductase [Steroidobacteraceae bacterium]